jgi:hypothetical protein
VAREIKERTAIHCQWFISWCVSAMGTPDFSRLRRARTMSAGDILFFLRVIIKSNTEDTLVMTAGDRHNEFLQFLEILMVPCHDGAPVADRLREVDRVTPSR